MLTIYTDNTLHDHMSSPSLLMHYKCCWSFRLFTTTLDSQTLPNKGGGEKSIQHSIAICCVAILYQYSHIQYR